MSAFICNAKHIGELVKWWVKYEKKHIGRGCDPSEIATVLAEQNIRSVEYRYPDTKEVGGAVEFGHSAVNEGYVAECIALSGSSRGPQLTAADIFKMACCYDYQACETEDYEETQAKKIVNKIIHAAGWEMSEILDPKIRWELAEGRENG